MPDATNHLALLREHGVQSWVDLGRQLFHEIPKDENGWLYKGQINSYLQNSFGLPQDRAAELFSALKRSVGREKNGRHRERGIHSAKGG